MILMAFIKHPFVLEPEENLVLTAVCEENTVQNIEEDPIRGVIAAVWEVSVYKLIKKPRKNRKLIERRQ
jgi:hypothetical protein